LQPPGGFGHQFGRGIEIPDIPTSEYLVLLRFSGYSDAGSVARVMGLWPGMTQCGDCRLSG
jgi:hypothetical protein